MHAVSKEPNVNFFFFFLVLLFTYGESFLRKLGITGTESFYPLQEKMEEQL